MFGEEKGVASKPFESISEMRVSLRIKMSYAEINMMKRLHNLNRVNIHMGKIVLVSKIESGSLV